MRVDYLSDFIVPPKLIPVKIKLRPVRLQIGLHADACFCLQEADLKSHLLPVSLIPTRMTRTSDRSEVGGVHPRPGVNKSPY